MSPDEWCGRAQFESWPAVFASRLNHFYMVQCEKYQKAYERCRNQVVRTAAHEAVRRDTTAMTRWSAVTDLVVDLSQRTYDVARSLGVLAAIVGSATLTSRGPRGLEVALIALVVVLLGAAVVAESDLGDSDSALTVTVVAASGASVVVVVLLLRPDDGFGVLTSIGAAVVSLLVALVITFAWDRLVGLFWTLTRSTLVAGAAVLLLAAVWRAVPLQAGADWTRVGMVIGLRAGLVAGGVLGAIQVMLHLVLLVKERLIFRYAPEAEFVQSTLWVLDGAETRPPQVLRSEPPSSMVWSISPNSWNDRFPERSAAKIQSAARSSPRSSGLVPRRYALGSGRSCSAALMPLRASRRRWPSSLRTRHCARGFSFQHWTTTRSRNADPCSRGHGSLSHFSCSLVSPRMPCSRINPAW